MTMRHLSGEGHEEVIAMTQFAVRPARGLLDVFRRQPADPFGMWTWPPIGLFPTAQHAPIRMEEFEEDGQLVLRFELPGIDPAKDVEVEVADGVLKITAERKETVKEKGYYHTEMYYGAYTRTVTLPEGTGGKDVTAAYKDGILEVRIPVPTRAAAQPLKVPVTAR